MKLVLQIDEPADAYNYSGRSPVTHSAESHDLEVLLRGFNLSKKIRFGVSADAPPNRFVAPAQTAEDHS